MYKCSRCNQLKKVNEFYFTNKYRRKYCKQCEHKSQILNRVKKKLKAVEMLGGECYKCGYSKCHYALEFHHTNPSEKVFEPSEMIQGNRWETIIKELSKCRLVCANCHREETFAELAP